jgi:hypothetical protein
LGFSKVTQAPKHAQSVGEAFFMPLNVATTRRLVRTTNGGLTLVPQIAREDDLMPLCEGGKLPLILRALCEDTWGLIGCSYWRVVGLTGLLTDEASLTVVVSDVLSATLNTAARAIWCDDVYLWIRAVGIYPSQDCRKTIVSLTIIKDDI